MKGELEKIHTGYTDGPEISDTMSRGNGVDRSLIRISEKETIEFFNEGLKHAADYAKRMGNAQNHAIWTDISEICNHIREQGVSLFKAKGLSWAEMNKLIDARMKITNAVLEMKRKPQKRFIIN